MTFRQTAFVDGGYPAPFALSSPITIGIVDDDILEGIEYFQVHILETSDYFRVRTGQNIINVTITDCKSVISLGKLLSSVYSVVNSSIISIVHICI